MRLKTTPTLPDQKLLYANVLLKANKYSEAGEMFYAKYRASL